MNAAQKKSNIRRWWITLSFCFPYCNLFTACMFTIWTTQLDKRNDFRQAKFRGNWLRCVNPSRIQDIRCDTVLRLPVTLFALRSLKWTRQTGRAKPYAQSLALLSLKFPFQIDEFQQYLHKTSFLLTSIEDSCLPKCFLPRNVKLILQICWLEGNTQFFLLKSKLETNPLFGDNVSSLVMILSSCWEFWRLQVLETSFENETAQDEKSYKLL